MGTSTKGLTILLIVYITGALFCAVAVVLDGVMLAKGMTPFFGPYSPYMMAVLTVFNIGMALWVRKVMKETN